MRNDLLLQQLPRTGQVLNLSAAVVMHRFTGRYNTDWRVDAEGLDGAALATLAANRPGTSAGTAATEVLQPEDEPLVVALAADGRASISLLARLTGWSPARTRRRLDALLGSGSIYLDVDLAMQALGFSLQAMLWATVEPQHLDAFGNALVQLDAVTFAGAVSGSSNIAATVALTGVDALYRFVNRVGDLSPGLRQLEVVPVLRQIKQGGSMIEGDRLRGAEPSRAVRPTT